ncbi:MAG: cobalamin B12-binding domain-containing protein [Caldilineales bacterium]|nr:cobalamin B12-binding domain-containing protein [Caldilineales bacterium]
MTTSPLSPAAAIRQQIDVLATAIVTRQYARQAQVWQPYGAPGQSKSVRDARYHLEYLAEALDADAPELFTTYLAWVKVLFAGLGFSDTVLPITLECTRQVLHERLPADASRAAVALVDSGQRSLAQAPVETASLLSGDRALDHLARSYLQALLAGDRHTATRLIMQAVEEGASIPDLYLQVFQRSQREIGRLWHNNQINVAQEHYCTAATQLIISLLYPRIFTPTPKSHSLVLTCVGGELHELGARMVADLLELAGWDTHFLGANTPTASVLSILAERQAALLGISATMTFHVPLVRELVQETRRSGLDVRILVGGYPFNLAPQLWRSVGADGYAADAQEAVAVAARLIA